MDKEVKETVSDGIMLFTARTVKMSGGRRQRLF
jgi:hypothetical protein